MRVDLTTSSIHRGVGVSLRAGSALVQSSLAKVLLELRRDQQNATSVLQFAGNPGGNRIYNHHVRLLFPELLWLVSASPKSTRAWEPILI